MIVVGFRDNYMLRAPGLNHRTIPNKKQAPTLAKAAKIEHVSHHPASSATPPWPLSLLPLLVQTAAQEAKASLHAGR